MQRLAINFLDGCEDPKALVIPWLYKEQATQGWLCLIQQSELRLEGFHSVIRRREMLECTAGELWAVLLGSLLTSVCRSSGGGGWMRLGLRFLFDRTRVQSPSEFCCLFLSGAIISISFAINNHQGKVLPKKAKVIRRFLFFLPQVRAD